MGTAGKPSNIIGANMGSYVAFTAALGLCGRAGVRAAWKEAVRGWTSAIIRKWAQTTELSHLGVLPNKAADMTAKV